MYPSIYFINMTTGKLLILRADSPSNIPIGNDWKEVDYKTFTLLVLAANYAFHGYYDIFPD